ncbi:MAG: hypothetical protein KBA46_01930 [Candidatus Omnitrophica bacterium]|nr:hypothetical protein [Candidatus Omnitrophota bacterium]
MGFEWGVKDYLDKKAIAHTLGETQDNGRHDERKSIEYSLVSGAFKDLYLKLRGRFSLNDSNARYLDFYDYTSFEVAPSISYKLIDTVDLFTGFSYLRKKYSSRTVIGGDEREENTIYSANAGVRVAVNKKNSVLLNYIYRNGSSNEALHKYTENVISCGWQYNF